MCGYRTYVPYACAIVLVFSYKTVQHRELYHYSLVYTPKIIQSISVIISNNSTEYKE